MRRETLVSDLAVWPVNTLNFMAKLGTNGGRAAIVRAQAASRRRKSLWFQAFRAVPKPAARKPKKFPPRRTCSKIIWCRADASVCRATPLKHFFYNSLLPDIGKVAGRPTSADGIAFHSFAVARSSNDRNRGASRPHCARDRPPEAHNRRFPAPVRPRK